MADDDKRRRMLEDDDDVAEHNPMAIADGKPKRSRRKKKDDDAPGPTDAEGEGVTIHGQTLLSLVERIENVHVNIAEYKQDEKDLYGEAKGLGYDIPVIRRMIKVRKQDRKKIEEQDMIFDTYMRAIGGY